MRRSLALAILAVSTVTAGINEWTSLGPDGGMITAIVVDPQNPRTLYAGTTGNGVFKTLDAGATWRPANSGLSNNVIALAIAPGDTNTLYAAVNSYGVYKTTDGGANWNPARYGLTDALGNSGWVLALTVDPVDAATVYAAGEGGVFKTTDGGDHWNVVLPGSWVTSLAMDAGNPPTVYAGGVFGAGSREGVGKTTDGGATWSVAGYIPSRGSYFGITYLLIDPRNPETLYAGSGSDGVFKSVDGGASWSSVNSGLPENFRRTFGMAMDPANPSTLYALLLFTGPWTPDIKSIPGRLFHSIDGGGSWEEIGSGLPAASFDPLDYCSCAPLKAGLAVDPETRGTLYVGTDSEGVFKSVDAGTSWKLSSCGLRANPVTLAIDPRNAGTFYAATPMRVFKSVDAGRNWSAGPRGPDAFYSSVVLDSGNPETIFVGTLGYGEDGRTGQVIKSTDGGMTWSGANLQQQVWSMTSDPQIPATVFATTAFGPYQYYTLLKTTDGAGTWSKVTPGPVPTSFFTSSLAFDPQDPGTLLAGGSMSNQWVLLKSSDGGASWTRLASHEGRITALAIDPQTTSTIYAGCSFQGCSAAIFKSTDGGTSLRPSGSGLPQGTIVRWLVIDPRDPRKLYAGTTSGVFRTSDAGASWSAVGSGLPEIASLALDPADSNTLYAATAGGVYIITFTGK